MRILMKHLLVTIFILITTIGSIAVAKPIVGETGSQIVVSKYINQHNQHLELQLPVIKRLGLVKASPAKLNQLNQRIRNEFTKYDTKNDFYLETSAIKILQDSKDYLSFTLHIETSDLTSRYFDKYYVIDKHSIQILSPRDVRRTFGFSLAHINSEIKHYIDSNPNSTDEVDVAFDQFEAWYREAESLYQKQEPTGVYLKPNVFGISYDSNKFTQTFEFNSKTKKLVNN